MMKLLYGLLLSCIVGIVHAQKLPDIQSASMAAPTSVRIDGKNIEWGNFSADNKRTGVVYTLANDDKNLYLAVKATDNETITKILAGAISFSINTKGKKKEEEAFTITYPLIARNNTNRGGGQGRQRIGQGRTEQTQEQRDSAVFEQRKTQLAGIKEIKIKGFDNIPDSLISIYNEYGIKAVAKMDDQKAYFCETAIPLSLLGISVNDKKEIAYQIKLNGRQGGGGNFAMRANTGAGSNAGGNFGGGNNRGGGGFGGNNRGGFGGANANSRQDLMTPTDFWGKYIIQKQ